MMRNIKSRKWLDKSRYRNSEPPQQPPQEEITPSSGWIEDSTSHYLLLELPDFRQEEIKMQFEGPDRVKISGERKTADKTIYFDKTYGVPDHADMERTNWKLEGGIFTVTIPKRLEAILSDNKSAEKDFQEISNSLPDFGDGSKKESDDEQVDENLKDQELQKKNEKSAENDSSSQRNQLNNAAKMICQSKNTIFMTLIAFCLGVLVSRKIGQ